MLEFKNLDYLTKEYSFREHEFTPKKISASDLKKISFKIDKRPFWGIAFDKEGKEVLIAEADDDGGIFHHTSEEFIQKVIQNFYEDGFLMLKLNKIGLICIDSDPNPYSYYGYFGKHKIYKQDDERNKYGSSSRLVTLGIDFIYEILFYQGVGPYSESHAPHVEVLVDWVNEELNGLSI